MTTLSSPVHTIPTQLKPTQFLFVKVDRRGKSGSKDVLTAIHKHVMRDMKKKKGPAERSKTRLGQEASKGHVEHVTKAAVRAGDAVEVVKDIEEPADVTNAPSSELCRSRICESSMEISWPVSGGGRMDPFAQYPVDINLDSLFLIDHVYTSSDIALTPVRDSWLPISMNDPAAFCEVLSYIALHVASLHPGKRDYDVTIAYKYHAFALQSVSQRLIDPVLGISDDIVQAIIWFACFSYARKDWDTYRAHVAGLKTIFRLRGGIHTLDHIPLLRLLLSGIDSSASCFQNIPPSFRPPLAALENLRKSSTELPWALPVDGLPKLWSEVFPGDSNLSLIFADLCATVMFIKSEIPKQQLWQSATFVEKYLNPLVYRLLDSTIGGEAITEDNFMNEACRLAALLLLAFIRRKFASNTSSEKEKVIFTGVEQEKLKAIMEKYFLSWRKFQPIILWVCVLAGMETEVENEKDWWACLVSQAAQELGIVNWESITVRIKNLLWVSEVLDSKCELFSVRAIARLSHCHLVDYGSI